MKSIEELQADLKQLYAELEERRIMEQESVHQTVNFEELSSKAERYKIENHPMSNRDEHEQSMYLLLLLSVIALDETGYEKSFSLLYRISHGMNFKGDIQEIFLQAQQINFERIDDITRLFINNDVKLVMLMEAMMIAQGFKKEYKKAMEYIAELCILMKLEKEQVILISNIARVVLTKDYREYRYDKNVDKIFDCYVVLFDKCIHKLQLETIAKLSNHDLQKYVKIKYIKEENKSITFACGDSEKNYAIVFRNMGWNENYVNIEIPLGGNYLHYINKDLCEYNDEYDKNTNKNKIMAIYGPEFLNGFVKRNFPELFKED